MSLQRSTSRRKGSYGSRRRASEPKQQEPTLLELKTIYEGPCGPASKKLLHKTSLVITNRTVEIEREGANLIMSILTCGCWYACFQTASIEIYELQCIETLYLRDNVIHGELRGRGGGFVLDCPAGGDVETKDLFFELKEAWQVARHATNNDTVLRVGDGNGDMLVQEN